MRLYLSSYHFGAHQQRLRQLVGPGRRTALVANALDMLAESVRTDVVRQDLDELTAAGLQAKDVDLRATGTGQDLAQFDLIWVRGGNTFVLRRALADSGADTVLRALLDSDAITYGGYSAGACVLAPDLSPLQAVDDISVVPSPITAGLGILDRPLIPHVRSPGHPETTACTAISDGLRSQGHDHWALADGDVLLVDGTQTQLLPGS